MYMYKVYASDKYKLWCSIHHILMELSMNITPALYFYDKVHVHK